MKSSGVCLACSAIHQLSASAMIALWVRPQWSQSVDGIFSIVDGTTGWPPDHLPELPFTSGDTLESFPNAQGDLGRIGGMLPTASAPIFTAWSSVSAAA